MDAPEPSDAGRATGSPAPATPTPAALSGDRPAGESPVPPGPSRDLPAPTDTISPRTVILSPPEPDLAERARTNPSAPAGAAQGARDLAGRPFGRYRLLEELGHGGMGIVWKAWDTSLRRVVALKMVFSSSGPSAGLLQRFAQEARLAAKLKHPHIVAVHDVGEFDGQPYFTTEFVEGATLGRKMESPVPLETAVEWIRQVAEALHYAHLEGVLHRDVKPDNVLIDGTGRAWVTDFGLAKDVELERDPFARPLTVSGALVGTPEYMSPEQASGRRGQIGAASDQFALGVVLYELLTGKKPFAGQSLRELLNAIAEHDPVRPSVRNPALGGELGSVCLRMLEKDPARRYPDLSEVVADLARWKAGEPVRARPSSWVGRLARGAVRRRAVLLPAGGLALAALMFAGWALRLSLVRTAEAEAAIRSAREAEAAAADGTLEAREAGLLRARDWFGAALALDADLPEARHGSSRVEQALAALASARAEAARMLEQAGDKLALARAGFFRAGVPWSELVKRVEAARALVEQALALRPDLTRGRFLLGQAWDLLGRDDEAERCWRAVIEQDPGHGPAHFRLGQLSLFRAYLSRCAPFAEGAPSAEESRRLLEEATGHLKQALRADRRAGADDESQLWREAAKALRLLLQDGYAAATALAARALKILAGSEGREVLHWILGCASPDAGLMRHFDRAIEVKPRFPLALFCRGSSFEVLGDLARARADYDAALECGPRLVPAWVCRGLLRMRGGDLDGALADLDAAVALAPGNEWALDGRGTLRERRGEPDHALADYDAVVAVAPAWHGGWYHRVNLCWRLGRLSEAEQHLARALKALPEAPTLRHASARIRLERGDLEGAESDAERAVAAAEAGSPVRRTNDALLGQVRAAAAEARKIELPAALRPLWGAGYAFRLRDFAAARTLYDEALATLPASARDDPSARPAVASAHFELACLHARARAGRLFTGLPPAPPGAEAARTLADRCFAELDAAIDLGWNDRPRLDGSEDLRDLHSDPRWAGIAARVR